MPLSHPVRVVVSVSLFCVIASAQKVTLTLPQAVQRAVDNYPAVRGSLEQVSAALAGIRLARTSYLPRVDFAAQLNRATHNNVFGLLLPQSVIPSISGPVLGTNSLSSVWGTAAGTLVSWEPFDFGLRQASVAAAEAGKDRAAADVTVTKLRVATAAADAFLTIAAAEKAVTAAHAGVERSRVLNQIIGALAQNELRPGADASRTRAELAVAQTHEIQAEQALAVARASLGQLLALPPEEIALDPGVLLSSPPAEPFDRTPPAEHPIARIQAAAVSEVKAREKILDRTYYPHFYLEGSAFARGTGIQPDGHTGGFASGLGPNIQNWALGATVSFPAFDLFSIRAKKEIEVHNERSETAKYDQVLQDLSGERLKAQAVLDGARRVAQNTPIQLEAARATQQQASARYRAGLGNVAEVAEAERLLTQAEIDNALAQLAIWRALLGLAAAQGDLTPFLTMAGR